ncbi:MAG: helix-turn-helix domain-containing protein [Rhizomicrobium sp.]
MAYREAAGWLRYAHVGIHPHDLALRDNRLTGSYGAAFRAGRLAAEIPATAAQGSEFEVSPCDILVDRALRLARLWRRLAELRTWRPLENVAAVQKTLESLGSSAARSDREIADWLASAHLWQQGPQLIRIGRAARDWINRAIVEPRSPDGIFFAACLWREKLARPIPLPFWSAPEPRHYGLELHIGLAWMADFLDCIAAAAKTGLDELDRLRRAEDRGRQFGRTARSRLPAALNAALRAPIITARDLAATLDVTTQASLGLLRQLVEAGILREATGRASWRAFTLA